MSATTDPYGWRLARITARWPETARAATLRLHVDGWPGHRAGQRVDLRLTAEDGYQATRAYSIASAPSDGTLDITVERLEDGEVSPYLVDVAEVGDELEVRGPIGGFFTWQPSAKPRPLVLLAGGAGLVPLMAMVREAAGHDERVDIRLATSTRTREDLLYAGELAWLAGRGDLQLVQTLTREQPPSWPGHLGRIGPAVIDDLLDGLGGVPDPCFLCGTSGFVDAASTLLLAAGAAPAAIRTERFGPSA